MSLLGEGPGSRLLLVALAGGEPDELAERSRTLRDALHARVHQLPMTINLRRWPGW